MQNICKIQYSLGKMSINETIFAKNEVYNHYIILESCVILLGLSHCKTVKTVLLFVNKFLII